MEYLRGWVDGQVALVEFTPEHRASLVVWGGTGRPNGPGHQRQYLEGVSREQVDFTLVDGRLVPNRRSRRGQAAPRGISVGAGGVETGGARSNEYPGGDPGTLVRMAARLNAGRSLGPVMLVQSILWSVLAGMFGLGVAVPGLLLVAGLGVWWHLRVDPYARWLEKQRGRR